ncbi:MAG: DUF4268 domain-containing protein [Flavisolibacter sp.]
MYSRQEASLLRQEFWTGFGQYMALVPSAEGEKINWINYKTGEKNISFRMHADNKKASVGIELTHKDHGIRELYFEQFSQLKKLLEECTGEVWQWRFQDQDEQGRTISRIFQDKQNVNIFKKEDWPELVSFFKPRLMALDNFWSQTKYVFEGLGR